MEESTKYFEKVYSSGTIEELNDLAGFYNDVEGSVYRNMSKMVVD